MSDTTSPIAPRATPEGGPHRPEVAINGITWLWDDGRQAYRIKGANLPIIIAYMGAREEHSIFHGWTMLVVGCGVGLGGYYGPDGPMVEGVERVHAEARSKLRRAQRELREAVQTCRAVSTDAV